MPRRNASRPQAKPVLLTRECIWPGCPAPVGGVQIACRPDWARLPPHLRHAWTEARKSGSAEAVELARSAIAAYASRNRVSEEAGTSR
jgi:hypothetical protein